MELLSHLPESLVGQLVGFYRREWWTTERSREQVERMLAGSTEVVAAVEGELLVGFGRALSDGAFRAIVFDLIVTPERRGGGLGITIMEEILARPTVSSSNRVELICLPEMAPFYERFGFAASQPGVMRMIRGHEVSAAEA